MYVSGHTDFCWIKVIIMTIYCVYICIYKYIYNIVLFEKIIV